MLTRSRVEQAIAVWQKPYVDFLSREVAQWRLWAKLADSMVAGRKVCIDEVPEFFKSDYEWVDVVLAMGEPEQFNWNDPRIARLFAKAVQTPFYKLWGDTIVGIALGLAKAANIAGLLEMGAGRGNLSASMLQSMHENNIDLPVTITDAHAAVLENLDGLKQQFSGMRIETVLWDVDKPPPDQIAGMAHPVLLYERASLTYANFMALKNLARAADVLVMGDYFNYTGELFAYDLLFEKIGLKPLMFRDVRALLEDCFSDHIIVDQRVNDMTGLPNVSLIVAWK